LLDLTDEQLSRYSRHILLDGIGIEGQQAIAAASVVVVGAGGLGCPVALYLAASGVGTLHLVDHDQVELTNLQRQIAHGQDNIGQSKVGSLQAACERINPDVRVLAHAQRADDAWLGQWLPQASVVVDCTDNFQTRQRINRACVAAKVPLVSGAAVQLDAQLSVFDPREPSSPCYACVFEPTNEPVDMACSTMGVLAPLVGVVGSMQAMQVLALITGCATPLVGQLLMLDARDMGTQRLRVERNPRCTVCGTPH
jgi:molybdopterin-synthase adenylyltransferase